MPRLSQWMRVIVFLLATELTGGAHAVLDLVVAAGLVEHASADCEQDGRECPPGCPGCHGATCTLAAYHATAPVTLQEPYPPHREADGPWLGETLLPPSPDRARLDRPPRPRVVFS